MRISSEKAHELDRKTRPIDEKPGSSVFRFMAFAFWYSSISFISSGDWNSAVSSIIFAAIITVITRHRWRKLNSSEQALRTLAAQEPPDSPPKLISREQALRTLAAQEPPDSPPKLTFSEWARRKLWGQESPDTQDNRPGKVYIVQSGQYYKIGITQGEVPRRVAQLQTGSPHKIHIVHVIETDYPLDLERDLHKMLAHKRGEGEWFRLSEEELRIIKRLK